MEKEVTQLQINMAELQKDISYIKEKLDSHIQKETETIERMENAFTDFLDKANTKFASKWIEKLVYSVIVAMFIAVIGVFVKVVTTPPQGITKADIQSMIEQNNNKYFQK